jgi:hypothetical protein
LPELGCLFFVQALVPLPISLTAPQSCRSFHSGVGIMQLPIEGIDGLIPLTASAAAIPLVLVHSAMVGGPAEGTDEGAAIAVAVAVATAWWLTGLIQG